MKSTLVRQDSDTLADVVVRGMQDRKGSDIVVLNLKHLQNAVADYFIICSANSDTQLDAIAQRVPTTLCSGQLSLSAPDHVPAQEIL